MPNRFALGKHAAGRPFRSLLGVLLAASAPAAGGASGDRAQRHGGHASPR